MKPIKVGDIPIKCLFAYVLSGFLIIKNPESLGNSKRAQVEQRKRLFGLVVDLVLRRTAISGPPFRGSF